MAAGQLRVGAAGLLARLNRRSVTGSASPVTAYGVRPGRTVKGVATDHDHMLRLIAVALSHGDGQATVIRRLLLEASRRNIPNDVVRPLQDALHVLTASLARLRTVRAQLAVPGDGDVDGHHAAKTT